MPDMELLPQQAQGHLVAEQAPCPDALNERLGLLLLAVVTGLEELKDLALDDLLLIDEAVACW